jgi:hypothetical protein
MYRNYRKNRYKRYSNRRHYRNNEPSDFEWLIGAIITIIFRIAFWAGKQLFGLIQGLFEKKSDIGTHLKISDIAPPIPTPIPIPPAPTAFNQLETVPTPQQESQESRYGLRQSLLTPSEQNFLGALEQVVGDQYRIECQVQLSRIVTPLDSNEHFTNYRDFNQIKAKSIDFVLYDRNYKPYLCIELDDRTHLRWDRMKRDAFVNQVMKDVGLPIIHIPAAYSYNLDKLGREIFAYSPDNSPLSTAP